jgi:hypothetical protein
MDPDPETVIPVLRERNEAGKGVIRMKILGQGQLAYDVNRAIRHAVQLDFLAAFTIRLASRSHLEEVAAKMPALSIA